MSDGFGGNGAAEASASSGYPFRSAVILVVDLVESVRVMCVDELGVIARWRDFMQFVKDDLLHRQEGRLVKNLGDGLMMEFASAQLGVLAATGIHDWWSTRCKPLGDGSRLAVRAGLHAANIFDATTDIYGIGVNLASRIAALAGPGETVTSVEAKDLLIDSLDADMEDLGDCHLKHIAPPVRVFRIGPAQAEESMPRQDSHSGPLLASLAIIPFSNLLGASVNISLGDLIADGIIGQLSLSRDLHVVSRLSTAGFRDRALPLKEIGTRLNVRYVVSGAYVVAGRTITISAELADVNSGHVVWSQRLVGPWKGLLSIESPLTHELAESLHKTVLDTSVAKALVKPIPTLPSYELFLGGLTLMHRANTAGFEQSRRLLEALVERHPRTARPHAWLAKWHVLRAIQGVGGDSSSAALEALEHTGRALNLEPSSALALAVEGFVHCHLKKDLDAADTRLREACQINSSESLAWLFFAVTQCFRGESVASVNAARCAIALSPMDPLRYYYESLMGSCEFGAGRYEEAIKWCESSRLRNRQHLSTLRVLIAANVAAGRMSDAAAVGAEVLRLKPDYSVAAYESQSVAALYPFGRRISEALRAAGIP